MSSFHPPRLQDEQGRLSALRRYEIMDTEPEREFDDIATLVRSIFNVDYAAITLVDVRRQWRKATAGFDSKECAREDAFCNITIQHADVLAVENATQDIRFMLNPFVTGEAHIRSYLGVPLTSPDGYNIGSLCVFDTEPRTFTPAEADVLRNFAKVVMSQFELRLIARRDSLTGMLTRRAFLERVDAAIDKHGSAALLLIDLDHFKSVNDTFGHPAGDVVLQSIAQVLQKHIDKPGAIGRLGGEEFGVLLPAPQDAEFFVVAERLRLAAADEEIPEVGARRQTLSIGIALYAPGESRDHWMARADQALYAAKHAGRNLCSIAGG